MHVFLLVLLVPAVALAGTENFAQLAKIDFSIRQQMRIGEDKATCVLRREVAQALARAQAALKLSGYGLRVYDCYRPTWAGKRIGQPPGDPHAAGGAVDATLVDDRTGNDLVMPSAYDETGGDPVPQAARPDARAARKNAARLVAALAKEGFQSPVPAKWWHFVWKEAAAWEPQEFPYAAVK